MEKRQISIYAPKPVDKRQVIVLIKEKYGIDPDYVPDLTGLDILNASASAQFNEWQFRCLADALRAEAEGKEIIVFDLCRKPRLMQGFLIRQSSILKNG